MGVRLANTLSNVAYPTAGALGWVLGLRYGAAFFVVMLLLGVASALWHWLFYPYNRVDRYAMFLVLSFFVVYAWALPLWVTVAIFVGCFAVDQGWSWAERHSRVTLAVLGVAVVVAMLWAAKHRQAAVSAAIFGLAFYVSEEDDETHNRTGPIHPVWHLLTAAGFLYIYTIGGIE